LKYLDIVFGVEANQVFQDAKSETNDGKIDYEIKFPMIRSELSSTNLVITEKKKVLRPINDRTVYDLFVSMLRNQKTVVIIENAQHCDELSWNELLLLIAGTSMDLSILITLKSSSSTSNNGQTEINNKRIYSFNNLHDSEASPPTTTTTTLDRSASKRRISVLRDAILLHKQPISFSKEIDRSASRDLSLDINTVELAAVTRAPSLRSNSPALKGNMKYQSAPSFQSIYRHDRTVVIDMSGLNRNEVEEVLLEKLNIDTISSGIIDLVLQVSSGNAYWCNVVADFIKERGVKELEDALEKKENVLRHLIILRMENLESDYQLVLKYASVIGEEFSEMMLLAVLPPHLSQVLPDYLDTLAENGFVSCIEEYPELIYGFQNDLIRETLSGLLPIRDVSSISLLIARFIETSYSTNLRPFYPLLSNYYSKSLKSRPQAFKYKLKSADQSISKGAYAVGLLFLKEAYQWACSGDNDHDDEYEIMLKVCAVALEDLRGKLFTIKSASVSYHDERYDENDE